jgi:hypothetical protein
MHIFWDIPDLGFHISIFMPKILGNSSDKNNKSCRIFHNGSNKTRFAFFVFFYDFIWILQDLANHIYYLRIKLRSGPWNFPTSHICPRFTKTTPGKIEEPAIGSLGRPPAALAGFRRGGGRGRWGEGGKGHASHLAVDLRRFRRSGTPVASARWSPTAAAAAAPNPAKGQRVPSNERVWGLEWMLGRVSGCCHGAGNEPRRRLACGL